jgi:hypothetical protein
VTRAVRSTEIRLRDNVYISVSKDPGSDTVMFYAPPRHRDPKIDTSGLGPHQSWFEPGDGSAEYKGMPVEAVRAYCRLHGGVAEAGEMALALLKKLPSGAAEPAPLPSSPLPRRSRRPLRRALFRSGGSPGGRAARGPG